MGTRLTALAALLLAVLLLSGCNGSKETDQVAYIIGLGLDKAEDHKIRVTLQVALPRALGGEKVGNSESASANVTYTAPTLAEAYNLIGTQIPRSTNLSHIRMVVVGSELAKAGVGEILASFTRYREFRGSIYFLTVKEGTAEKFLGNLRSVMETLPSKYIEGLMLASEERGYFPASLMHYFGSRLKEKSAAPYTALVAINPMTGRDRPSKPKTPEEKADEYTAGNIPIEGKATPANTAGIALYREDKMVGTLTTEETRMVQVLMGHLKLSFQVLVDPLAPDKAVNTRIKLRDKPTIHAARREGRYQFHAVVHLEGEITSIPSGIHYEQSDLRKQLEDQISVLVHTHIMEMLGKTQELGCDVVGFGYYARHLYASYPEWQQAARRWPDDYSQAEITVEVKTNLRRMGLLWQTVAVSNDPSGQ